jgi:predicted lipoprotein with Yx(FWY)xxD motif
MGKPVIDGAFEGVTFASPCESKRAGHWASAVEGGCSHSWIPWFFRKCSAGLECVIVICLVCGQTRWVSPGKPASEWKIREILAGPTP